ncbi:MAG: hypothetical protein IPO25_04855 [Saprospiraceae bacterium]|nr:hypothetical protein [Saprospiraceae bacterium]
MSPDTRFSKTITDYQLLISKKCSSAENRKVVQLLRENEYMSIDRLYHELQLAPSAIAGLLLELEFKGVIKALPGKNIC